MIELTGSRSKIVHRPMPQDDPKQRRPDISDAKALLDWAPRTSRCARVYRRRSHYFDELLKDQGVRASLVNAT